MSENNIVELDRVVTVKNLADKLSVPVTKIIALLMKNGIMATINESLDFETAAIITEEFGFTAQQTTKPLSAAPELSTDESQPRPPVVTIMGHVDHGKTTLLDTIRQTSVASSESGGITQHISAYQVMVKHDKKERAITFLDTPGHAAFTALRQHGANITDIVVLAIAADDGIKPQTIEAIDHAKQANADIIVAITKMDSPKANPERIKQQLAELEMVPEEWGGKTIVVPVSAKTNQGLDVLLDMILVVADLNVRRAAFRGMASAVVIESHIQPGKGPVATVLVQSGILKVGDTITVGATYGKVRTLENFLGKKTDTAGPSDPSVISGLKALPNFGEHLVATSTEKEAKESAEIFSRGSHQGKVHSLHKGSLADSVNINDGATSELPVVIKADVVGSLEAAHKVLEEIGTDEVSVKITNQGIGPVSESDVTQAIGTKSSILAFRVSVPSAMRKLADQEHVTISTYDVIYDLVDDVKAALSKLLKPEAVEMPLGEAKVIALFKGDKRSQVIGVQVEQGSVAKDAKFHVLRKKELVADGAILTVRRGKDEVKAAESGQQAGLAIPGNIEVQMNDVLQLYYVEIRQRTLS